MTTKPQMAIYASYAFHMQQQIIFNNKDHPFYLKGIINIVYKESFL